MRLRPFLGLKPGVYLTVLYGILVAFALFMLLFYKGIRDQGTYLQVSSFPPNAAVRVDGIYAGSTPCEILLKKGSRSLEVSKPYFEHQTLEADFAGRVFATLFVKPRSTWTPRLELADPAALAIHALDDFAANPQIPEILWQTALASYQAGGAARDELQYFVDNAKYFITEPLQLNELLRAQATLDAGAQILTPTSLLATVQNIVRHHVDYENTPFWLSVVLPRERAQAVAQDSWFTEFLTAYQTRYADALSAVRADAAAAARSAGSRVMVLGQGFREVPAGTLLQGASEERNLTVQLPHPVALEGFYISETEIPAEAFALFLRQNPDWARGNIEQLLEAGQVEEGYLEGWNPGEPPQGAGRLPVVNVSYYAAEAFCRWLSGQLPPALEGYEARLPTESEWEWAARGGLVAQPYPTGAMPGGAVFKGPETSGPGPVGTSAANGYGLRDMAGNVWEWCADWYSPVKYLLTSWDPDRNANASGLPASGYEKVIRGGSWSNERELVRVYTRGSQPPSWCTPYLGFRVVLARTHP